jgi:GNAT superfamily N-acetyltransferase
LWQPGEARRHRGGEPLVSAEDDGQGGAVAEGIRLERVALTHPDALALVEEVQQEYVARYGTPDESPVRSEVFDPPDGAFFVGYLDERPVAMGGWRRRSDVTAFGTTSTAEIKRMYVVASVRGQGLARRTLAHLEQTAGAAGARVLVLETGTLQPEAIALYVSSGYRQIPGFGHYRDSPLSRCYARRLLPGWCRPGPSRCPRTQ